MASLELPGSAPRRHDEARIGLYPPLHRLRLGGQDPDRSLRQLLAAALQVLPHVLLAAGGRNHRDALADGPVQQELGNLSSGGAG